MTDVDEGLLTAAKLGEQARGDLEGDAALLEHAGVVADPQDRSALTFLASALEATDGPESLRRTDIGAELAEWYTTEAASEAVAEADGTTLSHLVGVTETEYDGSSMTVTMALLERLHADGAPAFVSLAGNPNSGKTATVALLVDLLDAAGDTIEKVPEDLMVVSNVASWRRTDVVVRSMHDLMLTLLDHRDRQKFVVIDEGSTHFDARTYRREVAQQWTPAAKRMAKMGVYACAVVGHTGKDLHPEAKRLTTLALWKDSKQDMMVFDAWEGDSDAPTDPVWPDPVSGLEDAGDYDPDDAAPWAWNLRPELFAADVDWSGLRTLLLEQGPAED